MSTQVSLFGNLRITVAGRTVTAVNTNRLQSLIAYLILHGDSPQPRERLAFLLWPESGESQARTNLRQLLHHLKRALPAECSSLATDHFTVQWRHDSACKIDAADFRAAIAESAAACGQNDRARELHALTTAARLYEDDLLPGLYDDWIAPLRDEYRQRMAGVLHRLALLTEERKDFAAAIAWANRLVALEPFCEAHHQLLMRLHFANQDRAGALRTYHQCMRVLRREMGVDPCPATRELFARILKAPPDPGAPGPSATKPVSQPRQSCPLVGRASEWQQLMEAWQLAAENGPRVVVISGEPGIGKTRLADEMYQWCVRHGGSAPTFLRRCAVRCECRNRSPRHGRQRRSGGPNPPFANWRRRRRHGLATTVFESGGHAPRRGRGSRLASNRS
ncbi:BTAD domain-containing putative transcriptional regulator [Nevskia soli]|uniref:BTAD domain-containing putative transcriptional regulator n=1 Tax=Nevskia soli TaxID=418856 RepID=UPI0015D6A994|nr:BTAD domain-containing putative transcriptional regulator [Nevskia soli]